MSTTNQQVLAAPSYIARSGRSLWRDLCAYWILGLCNNYGYVVMLSAAHDIIGQFHYDDLSDYADAVGKGRHCHIVSTGAILLADILPSLFVKIIMPFFPFWVQIALAVCFSATGFLLVGFASFKWMALLGVIVTSASSGIGETTFLGYSSNFNKQVFLSRIYNAFIMEFYYRNVVSTWSSGTGGAGVIGSLSYAMLRSLNVSPRDTMLIMLFFPCIEALTFWVMLRKPIILPVVTVESTEQLIENDKPLVGFKEKLAYIKKLVKYMLPLGLVYLFEYFINQGLFELIYFQNTVLDGASQYRWLNVAYQIGVFVSRSSVNIFQFEKIWLTSVFQFINVVYFSTEVIYFYTPSIWLTFAIVLWEGLLGGGAYVNTFYRMSKEITPAKQQFAMAMVVQSDSYGIALAGFLAIPFHNAICLLPAPIRGLI
uniref:Battenin n=1 Tax=Glossina palpalis gambiensis TaxID=67801 RepID=A0A1B0AKK2_9MUSC